MTVRMDANLKSSFDALFCHNQGYRAGADGGVYCLEFVQDGEIGREPADAAELVFGEPSGGLVLF